MAPPPLALVVWLARKVPPDRTAVPLEVLNRPPPEAPLPFLSTVPPLMVKLPSLMMPPPLKLDRLPLKLPPLIQTWPPLYMPPP